MSRNFTCRVVARRTAAAPARAAAQSRLAQNSALAFISPHRRERAAGGGCVRFLYPRAIEALYRWVDAEARLALAGWRLPLIVLPLTWQHHAGILACRRDIEPNESSTESALRELHE